MRYATPLHQMFLDSFESEKKLRHLSEEINQQIKNQLASLFAMTELKDFEQKKSLDELLWLSRALSYLNLGIRNDFKSTDFSVILLEKIDQIENELLDKQIKLKVEVDSKILTFADCFAISNAFEALLKGVHSSIGSAGNLNIKLEEREESINLWAFWDAERGGSSFSSLCFQVATAIFESHGGKLQENSLSPSTKTWELCLPIQSQKKDSSHLYFEKRRFPRVKVDLKAQVSWVGSSDVLSPGARSFGGLIPILSEGGALLVVSDPLPQELKKGAILSLNVFISSQTQFCVSEARLVDVQQESNDFRLGIEFLKLDNKAKKLLAALVMAHAS